MNIFFDYSNMLNDSVSFKTFESYAAKIGDAFEFVKNNRGKGWYEWCDLPYKSAAEIDEIITYAESVRKQSESFVVFGIGGSALGPLAVASSLLHLRHNELSSEKRNAPKFYVEDNVDPERMNSLLDIIDISKTHFNFITKSGETSETLSQFLILYSILKDKLGEDAARSQVTITTTLNKGTLFNIAKAEGLKIFDVEAGVGGRFSVLSNVGLVPLAVLGIDIKELLAGAKHMDEICLQNDIIKNPALMSAFLHVRAMENGKNISVMMPYADSLKFMSDFYAQLWGESLGKEKNLSGEIVRCGQTPVKALGVTDQHSQIQLYVEGPRDKIVTFIAVDNFRNDRLIPSDSSINACEFLSGNTLSKLINSERIATAFALTKAGCSNYTITLPEINENTIGQLLMYFMLQTAFAGALLKIDAFDQPGVEEGKKATFAILGRKGYEVKLQEITKQKENRFIINK